MTQAGKAVKVIKEIKQRLRCLRMCQGANVPFRAQTGLTCAHQDVQSREMGKLSPRCCCHESSLCHSCPWASASRPPLPNSCRRKGEDVNCHIKKRPKWNVVGEIWVNASELLEFVLENSNGAGELRPVLCFQVAIWINWHKFQGNFKYKD